MRRSHEATTRPDPAPRPERRPRRATGARLTTEAHPTIGARLAIRPRPAMRGRPAMRVAATIVALVLSAAFLPACTDSDPADSRLAIDRGEFIEVMVALRDANVDLERQDSVPEGRFEALRDSILAAHGVESVELYAFVNAHPDLDDQEALWDSINRRLKRPLAPPDVTGGQSGLPDSMEGLQQPPKPGDALERIGRDRR